MSLSLTKQAVFTNSIDNPKKVVNLEVMQPTILDIGNSPAGINGGFDTSKSEIVFVPYVPGQPGQSEKIVVTFDTKAHRDAAYAAIVSAVTAL